MAALVLVPTAARAAFAGSGPGPWSAVCSASGQLPASPADDGGAAAALDHCPLCSQFGQLPLPATAWRIGANAGIEPVPPFMDAAPHAGPAASLPQPRGPPRPA